MSALEEIAGVAACLVSCATFVALRRRWASAQPDELDEGPSFGDWSERDLDFTFPDAIERRSSSSAPSSPTNAGVLLEQGPVPLEEAPAPPLPPAGSPDRSTAKAGRCHWEVPAAGSPSCTSTSRRRDTHATSRPEVRR